MRMKFLVVTPRVLLPLAASLSIAIQVHAQQISTPVGPRPPKAGDEKIVRSTSEGYLRVYTPEIPVYDEDGFIGWDNENFRIAPAVGGGRAKTWFDRRPMTLNPGVYDIELVNPGIDVVEPHDANDYGNIRVLIRPGRITEVWLNDSDRPQFTRRTRSALARDVYGDVVGYRN